MGKIIVSDINQTAFKKKMKAMVYQAQADQSVSIKERSCLCINNVGLFLLC